MVSYRTRQAMDTLKLNGWLTVLTNIGVIVGLVFLVLEVQQNNEFYTLEVTSRNLDVIYNIVDVAFEDESAFETMMKDPAERTLLESVRLESIGRRMIVAYRRSWRDGYFDAYPELAATVSQTWNSQINFGMSEAWEGLKPALSSEFISWWESNVISGSE